MPGFSGKQVRRMGDDVLSALAEARRLEPITKLPSPNRRDGTGSLTEEEFELHEALKQWRRERAVREGFDASLVLNRHVLLRLALEKPRDETALRGIEGLLEWQVLLFGEEMLAVVSKVTSEGYDRTSNRRSRSKRRRSDG